MATGHYQGRHFTTYVEDVKQLKKSGRSEEAERLLLRLVDATEDQDKIEGFGVAPWYYEQLAVIYRQRADYVSECAILERFCSQRHAAGAKPALLISRLTKAQELLQKSKAGSDF